jgi:hypothetical protein
MKKLLGLCAITLLLPACAWVELTPAGDCIWEIPPSEKPGMRL